MCSPRILFGCLGLVAGVLGLKGAPPTASLENWIVEQMPGGRVFTQGDALIIQDVGGCTVWFRPPVSAPAEITYEVTVVSRGGPYKTPTAMPAPRSGRFPDYDSLQTYYVGMGGNHNTTTRFRRYAGDGAKPLLPAYDRGEKRFLLEPNQTYRIRLVARAGVAEFWRNGEKIFSFRDPQPLMRGWFAIRTVRSHLEIRNLQIKSTEP